MYIEHLWCLFLKPSSDNSTVKLFCNRCWVFDNFLEAHYFFGYYYLIRLFGLPVCAKLGNIEPKNKIAVNKKVNKGFNTFLLNTYFKLIIYPSIYYVYYIYNKSNSATMKLSEFFYNIVNQGTTKQK